MSPVISASKYVADNFPLIHDLATVRLKLSLKILASMYPVVAFSLFGLSILQSEDLFTAAGPIIGGDFIVFELAARVAGSPDMIAIYEMSNLHAILQAAYPGRGDFGFAWMYPPTMSLIIAPFAGSSYLVSFSLWVLVFGGAFFAVLRSLWRDKWALFFVAASPAVFQAIITGQNGFMTAALISAAGGFADRRPVLAGIAAGLLTVKPQLGLLIPVAFAAAGCWRAFFVAGVTALILAAASFVAFGAEAWIGFYDGMTAHGGRMGSDHFPFNKLVSLYGLGAMLAAPPLISSLLQGAATLLLATYVFLVWRRVKDWDIRLAALATSALLASPYAFYYEIVILAPALMLVARRAVETGWLRHERLTLIAAWIAPLFMPPPHEAPGLPICPAGALLAFAIVARRAIPAAGLRFSSARSPATAG